MVLVDTPVWSEFLRRKQPNALVRDALRQLIEEGDALLLGPIRQELLSGLSNRRQFERVRLGLRGFPDEPILAEDYETAASMFNLARSAGVQGSNTDFLICAVAQRIQAQIFTLDQDFQRFAGFLPIRLVAIGA